MRAPRLEPSALIREHPCATSPANALSLEAGRQRQQCLVLRASSYCRQGQTPRPSWCLLQPVLDARRRYMYAETCGGISRLRSRWRSSPTSPSIRHLISEGKSSRPSIFSRSSREIWLLFRSRSFDLDLSSSNCLPSSSYRMTLTAVCHAAACGCEVFSCYCTSILRFQVTGQIAPTKLQRARM